MKITFNVVKYFIPQLKHIFGHFTYVDIFIGSNV